MSIENLPNKQITHYHFERATLRVGGLAPMPAAGDDDTVFVRIHNAYETEVITWTAKCDGGAPVIPSPLGPSCPFGLNDNLVLLDMKISAVSPIPIGGGQAGHIFGMSGLYTYAKKSAGDVVKDIQIGKLPIDDDFLTTADTTFPAENFLDEGILDTTGEVPPMEDTTILQSPLRDRAP